eukprot:scaffold23809_cov62-Cyclotella_meneghiniana.AAC.7
MEVDLGVLQENAAEPVNNAAAAADAADLPNNEPPSTRFAVHRALKNANFIGYSCFGGKADGTMTLP